MYLLFPTVIWNLLVITISPLRKVQKDEVTVLLAIKVNSISFSRVIRPVWLTWTGLKTAPTSSPRLATTSCCSGTLRYVGRFPTEPPWGTWSGLPSPASSVSTPLAFGQKPSTEQVIQKLVPIHNVSKGVKPNSKNWLFYVIYNRAFGRRNFREMCLPLLGRVFFQLFVSVCSGKGKQQYNNKAQIAEKILCPKVVGTSL